MTIGYDICFVVALVKTARIVYIFRKVSPTKKASRTVNNTLCSIQKVKDWHLLLLSAGIVMIEVVYVIPVLTVDYVTGETTLEADDENPSFTNASNYFQCD